MLGKHKFCCGNCVSSVLHVVCTHPHHSGNSPGPSCIPQLVRSRVSYFLSDKLVSCYFQVKRSLLPTFHRCLQLKCSTVHKRVDNTTSLEAHFSHTHTHTDSSTISMATGLACHLAHIGTFQIWTPRQSPPRSRPDPRCSRRPGWTAWWCRH